MHTHSIEGNIILHHSLYFAFYPILSFVVFFTTSPKMRTIMDSKTSHDSSFSFSRRYLPWKKKIDKEEEEDNMERNLTFSSTSQICKENLPVYSVSTLVEIPRKKLPTSGVSKLRSALTLPFGKTRSPSSLGLGTRVVGTLFGYRRGHVHLAFQDEPKLTPAFLVELATPTSVLVKEMASGVVRVALECDKKKVKKGFKLLEEPIWRSYCNGKKYGYAIRRDCGAEEWKVLNGIGQITMGAGVLPNNGDKDGTEGELMYMRAKFERVVGSKDSQAFYMMNADGNGGPELSIYLLRG